MSSISAKLDHSQLYHSLQSLAVPSLFPDNPDFDRHARSYNRVFRHQPAVVCIPNTTTEIINVLTCAHTHGFKVQPKSGGHSYGAYSSGGQDGSVVIHMKHFSTVELDAETNIAIVGAGVRLGRLASELFHLGKRAVPHGSIQNVGVGGHFAHGGYGYQSRAWGLAVDTICGLDVVLADGRALHVTADNEPELWFALRGSADSFGIITNFHLETFAAPESVVLFSLDIADIVDNADEAASAFFHIQKVVQDGDIVDRDLSFGLYIHDRTWTIWGVYLGERGRFENLIAPNLLGGFQRPVDKLIQSMGWLECLEWFYGNHSNDATEEAFDTFYAQSVVIPEQAPLSEKVLFDYFSTMRQATLEPSQSWYAVINLHGGPGSRITSVSAESSSYTHRDSLWVIQHYGYSSSHLPPLFGSTKAVIKDLTQVIRDAYPESLGAEPNYQDPDLDREMANQLHYGEAALRRLAILKTAVDPDELFWNPQSIRPA